MDRGCKGGDRNRWGISAPCKLTYLLEGGTPSGAICGVVGMDCEVVSNVIVIVVYVAGGTVTREV
jgi:hypothetical protein